MTVGVDIEEISRFKDKSQHFYDKIFTKKEQEYCCSYKHPESHYAVRFCAKEAVIKAICALDMNPPFMSEIEVLKEKEYPEIRLPKKNGYEKLKIDVSLSHDKTKAIAFVNINV